MSQREQGVSRTMNRFWPAARSRSRSGPEGRVAGRQLHQVLASRRSSPLDGRSPSLRFEK